MKELAAHPQDMEKMRRLHYWDLRLYDEARKIFEEQLLAARRSFPDWKPTPPDPKLVAKREEEFARAQAQAMDVRMSSALEAAGIRRSPPEPPPRPKVLPGQVVTHQWGVDEEG